MQGGRLPAEKVGGKPPRIASKHTCGGSSSARFTNLDEQSEQPSHARTALEPDLRSTVVGRQTADGGASDQALGSVIDAQLYDPLGWLTPVTIRAKIAIQSTWLLGLGWDDPLPEREADQWRKYTAELPRLSEIQIPRRLEKGSASAELELHGFADASERATAAVLYLRVRDGTNQDVSLITAKSKVAPIKQVSLPRLELCAAMLLARLVEYAISRLNLTDTPVFLWTDSTVTLSWIQGHPSKWPTYEANRVAEIQRRAPDAHWNHLPGSINPADCASRGISPGDLAQHDLWWTGPPFLRNQQNPPSRPLSLPSEEGQIEQQTQAMVVTTPRMPVEHEMLKRHSSLIKLLRVTAWCRRWLPVRPIGDNGSQAETKERGFTSLSAAELDDAEKLWIRWTQTANYKPELRAAEEKTPLPPKSSLVSLRPFLDQGGILRVGGRIKHSLLPYDEMHPVILPATSRLALLIVESCHRKALHGGVQLTLSLVRHRYWIPRGRSLVKSCLHRCVTCVRWRAAPSQQLMADLPRPRVTPARPFQYTGLDYAGPVLLRASPGRGHRTTKAFFVIFVCMCTKAVHLDVASDYSAQAFLAALRRFISRRGPCTQIYSDCGTNFVGADAELRRLFAAHSSAHRSIAGELAESRIEWRFNPPGAPHFGGLWEAAVKSLKHHLRRVVGTATLTYEEMATLLSQIEACFNSRPLSSLSDDPADLSALTPGHFIIGSALTAIPEPSLLDVPASRLSRW